MARTNLLRFFLLALLLACSPAHAQGPASPAEISFWESVRDSKNPAELQAYIDLYPNGNFAVLAKARLAALQKPVAMPPQPPAPPQSVQQAAVAPGVPHKLQVGDKWTYRLSYPRLRGQWGKAERPPATHAITVSSVADGSIVDALSVDGSTPLSSTHAAGAVLLPQGASVFSPYLTVLQSLPNSGRLGSVRIAEPACERTYLCEAKARVAGRETISVPAGKFVTTKVVIDHEWRASGGGGGGWQIMRMTGGRTLTVWYAPEIGRAVKYSSRLTVGDVPAVDADFDLELVSYQLK